MRPFRYILALAFLAAFAAWIYEARHREDQPVSSAQPHSPQRSHHISPRRPLGPSAIWQTNAVASARYKNSLVLDLRETPLGPNLKSRLELVKTRMKYPLLRIESRVEFDPLSGKEKITVVDEAAAGHVLVQLQPGKTELDLRDAIRSVRGNILRQLRLDDPTFFVTLPEPSLDAVPTAVKTLSTFSNILQIAEPDRVAHTAAVPNDSRFGEQWALYNNSFPDEGIPGADVKALAAWDIHRGSTAAIVAVSDTGIDYEHRDLRDNLWVNSREIAGNFADDDRNGYIDDIYGWDFYDTDSRPYDYEGHGTFVAGIIGARGNNLRGIAGICWTARLMTLRTLGEEGGFNSDIAEAFDYARKMGAKTVNVSHSGGGGAVMKAAIDRLEKASIMVAAAAGNHSVHLDSDPTYPACYTNKNILSVGSCDRWDEFSDFSSFGLRNVDLVAPGEDILSTDTGDAYYVASGTSFATPHVAGACALLKSYHPEWNHLQIRDAILRNVDARPNYAGLCASGGRLNLRKAFLSAITLPQALDTTMFTWTTGGSAPWFGETRMAYDGVDAAECGEISSNQESWLQTTVNGPGTLYFRWRVSSEYDSDFLQFRVNGLTQNFISGDEDWREESFTFSPGAHVVRWRYIKDNSISSGQDRAWLDRVTYAGEPPDAVAISPATQNIPSGSKATFSATANGTAPLRFQWRKNGVKLSGATNSILTIANATITNAGIYTVTVSNLWGTVSSGESVLNICTYAVTPTHEAFGVDEGSSGIVVTTLCPWTATTSNEWITITSPSGEGNGVAEFKVAPNATGVVREGKITINGAVCFVTQFPELAPDSSAGKTFSMSVSNGAGGLEQSGVFQIALSAGSDAFWKTSPAQPAMNQTGLYLFARTISSNANLTLNSTNGMMDFALRFLSPSSGIFSATNDAGGSQNGSFQMFASRPDLNADGRPDLLLQRTNGQLSVWFMNGSNMIGSKMLRNGASPGAAWKTFGLADFNDDQRSDIVFQHTSGRLQAWLMDGTNFLRTVSLRNGASPGSAWRGAALNDFNNDGQADFLFQHNDGRLLVWFMQQTNFLGAQLLRNGLAVKGWSVAGFSDFNGDGQNDLLWQNTSGATAVWFMIGADYIGSASLRKGAAGWRIVALEDLDGLGGNDFLWQHSNGRLAVWRMSGTNFLGSFLLRNGTPTAPGWNVVGPK